VFLTGTLKGALVISKLFVFLVVCCSSGNLFYEKFRFSLLIFNWCLF
jgi:hypothetical protein